MSTIIYQDFAKIIPDYDVFLFDMWGVLIEEDKIYHQAVEMFYQLSKIKQVYLVTNSPTPSNILFERLKTWGINIKLEQIFTSGQIAKDLISNYENNVVIYELGKQSIVTTEDFEFTNDINKANIILLTIMLNHDDDLDQYDDLLKAAVQRNVTVICANPDIVVPSTLKTKYGPGYFALKYEKFGGQVIYTGKPRVEIYNAVFKTLPNIDKNKIIMIGDTLETDIFGANNAEIKSALLLTGNCLPYHKDHGSIEDKLIAINQICEKAKIIPTYITDIN